MSWTLGAGIAGSALFVLVFLVDGATRPGYDVRHHPVSALALGRRGWVQTSSFVVNGLLVTVSAAGLRAATGGLWLPVLVAVFGLALVASGVWRMDPMRGYPPGTPPGTPETTSRAHRLHDAAGAVVFVALPAAAAVAVPNVHGVGWAVYSALTAVALTGLLLAFGSAWERDAPWTGLLQRLMIVTGWAWLALLCWHLLP
ncbi:DUF998 domain-containing protein [Micromonospora fluostatini]|uniref:DUF998 domain-containing protein n=1 Tax=Micromonospora sp. JCM 30529 TaxID=3421643 RepID=UPI003D1854A8